MMYQYEASDQIVRRGAIHVTGGAELFVWLVAVFGIVAVVCWVLSRFVTRDSFRYDEEFTWQRDLDEHH